VEFIVHSVGLANIIAKSQEKIYHLIGIPKNLSPLCARSKAVLAV